MLSDALVLLKVPVSGEALAKAKKIMMVAGRSVVVHKPETPDRVLLVKFDPDEVAPGDLLASLRAAGLEASIAGG